jgi:hypothetical protein
MILTHHSLVLLSVVPDSSFPSRLSWYDAQRKRCGADLLHCQCPVDPAHAVLSIPLREALDQDVVFLFRSLVRLCGFERDPWAIFGPNIHYDGGQLEQHFTYRPALSVFRYINTFRMLIIAEHEKRGCKYLNEMVSRYRYNRGNSQMVDLRRYFDIICQLPDRAWKQGRPKWFPQPVPNDTST